MAGITLEGTLWIDLVDLWKWLDDQIGSATVKGLRFSVPDDALVVTLAKGELFVDAADFWRWVIDNQVPEGIRGLETVFGVPAVEDENLKVTFAASSEGDPRSWSTPPACLKEWKALKE